MKKRHYCILLLFLPIFIAAQTGQESHAKAKAAFQKGDYDTWFAESQKAAKHKIPESLYYMGLAYDPVYAKSIKNPADKSATKALGFYKQASELGYASASYTAAEMIRLGDGVEANKEESIMYYKKAYIQNHPKAANAVSQLIGGANYVKWLESLVQGGNYDAARELGTLYITGTFVEKNPDSAMKWLKTGAKNNHAGCTYVLGYMYRNGFKEVENGKVELFNEDKDIPKAVECYKKAANLGSWEACNNLGEMNMQGLEIKGNMAESYKWFKKSCELNNGYGCHMCSVLIVNKHVTGTNEEAQSFASKALQLGYKP